MCDTDMCVYIHTYISIHVRYGYVCVYIHVCIYTRKEIDLYMCDMDMSDLDEGKHGRAGHKREILLITVLKQNFAKYLLIKPSQHISS